jgi:hypothetical protein
MNELVALQPERAQPASLALPPLDVLQRRLRLFRLPPDAWQVQTFGALQSQVKAHYRARIKRVHPDRLQAPGEKLTFEQVVALKVEWMDGARPVALTKKYGVDQSEVQDILHERSYAFRVHPAQHAPRFEALTVAYRWLMTFPPEAPLPGVTDDPLWVQYRRLVTPLASHDAALPMHTTLDLGSGYHLVALSEQGGTA